MHKPILSEEGRYVHGGYFYVVAAVTLAPAILLGTAHDLEAGRLRIQRLKVGRLQHLACLYTRKNFPDPLLRIVVGQRRF